MLLTITTTHQPATDLGFLLHKHPDKLQSFKLPFGQAHVYYPEATQTRCTAALLLDIDPVALTRRERSDTFALKPYVNDRPYVTSSFMSVALARVLSSALAGRSERSELAQQSIALRFELHALPSESPDLLEKLFEPLGYELSYQRRPLDEQFPHWGESDYYTVTLAITAPLYVALRHLYVLIPVLDGDKHYWVDEAEVEKLLAKGEGWLAEHPEKELIARRYLKRQGYLTDAALEKLGSVNSEAPSDTGLHEQRLRHVLKVIQDSGARRVLDLGCGEGKLLRYLLEHSQFSQVTGMDVSSRALERAQKRLAQLPDKTRERLTLLHGSLLYRDERLNGYDAAALVEVIEHLDEVRLETLEQNVFKFVRPKTLVVTTPNRDYNAVWSLADTLRHSDHRFEWDRKTFEMWAQRVAKRYGYSVTLAGIGSEGIGPDGEALGAPTQLALFEISS